MKATSDMARPAFKLLVIIGFLVTCFLPESATAQLDTSFWFVAPRVSSMHASSPNQFKIASGNYANTTVTITRPADSGNGWFDRTINLGALQMQTVWMNPNELFPDQPQDTVPNQITNYGILIRSDNPITVYYETSGGNNNPDIFTLKGRNALGNHFITPSQDIWDNVDPLNPGIDWTNDAPKSAIDIVATEDNTSITVELSDDVTGHAAGSTVNITLNRGQTYRFKATSRLANGHLNGTVITADKPISVTISDDSVFGRTIGNYDDWCADLIGDQLIPTSILGEEYVVMKGWLEMWGGEYDRVFIQASQNNTNVQIVTQSGTFNQVVSMGNMGNFHLTDPQAYITADAPIQVLHASGNGCEMGGGIIPPIDQCTGSSDIAFVRTDQDRFGLNIIVKTGSEDDFTTSGGSFTISAGDFADVPGTGGQWKALNREYNTGEVPVNQNIRVQNSSTFFHLGMINGEATAGGTRYGYFSSFSNLDLGDDQDICPGSTITLTPGAGADSYLWQDGTTETSLTTDVTGLYSVTATFGGCTAEDEVTLTFYPGTGVDLGPDFAMCLSTTLDAGAGQTTYEWSTGESTQAITIPSPANYHVTVTDANGCVDRDTIAVSPDTNPTVSIDDAAICDGDSLTLDAGAGLNYLWSDGSTNQTLVIKTAGNYSVTVEDGGCTASDDMTLTVNALPTITLNDAQTCEDQPLTLNPGAGFANYNWSTGAGSQTIVASAEGDYHVTVTDNNGCTDRDTMNLTFYAEPTVTLTDGTICQGDSLQLDAGAGVASYDWTNGASTQTVYVSVAGSYGVTVTTSDGCTDNSSMNLTVTNNPSLSLADASICDGETLTLDAGGGFTYAWTTGESTQTIDVTTANTYGVTITAGSCSSQDDMTLTVNSNPTVSLADDQTCQGVALTLDAGAGMSNYNWSDGSNGQTTNVTTASNYHVTVTDANGCTDRDTMSLSVVTNPVVANLVDTCNLTNDGFTVTFDIVGGDPGSYNVSGLTGTLVGSTFTSDPLADSTTYSISLDDANGCGPDVVNRQRICGCDSEAGAMDIATTLENCGPGTITGTYVGTGENLDGNDMVMFILQTSGAAALSTVIDTALGTPSFTFDPAIMSYDVTYYISAVVGTDVGGFVDLSDPCLSVSAGTPIIFHALPVVTLNDAAICQGNSQGINVGTFASYNWSTGASTQSVTVNTAGDYSITVTDADGCTDRDTMTLTVNALPVVTLDDASICSGDDLVLDAGTGFTYVWSTAESTQTITVSTGGNYSVVILDGNNCSATDNMDLTITNNPPLNLANVAICDGATATISAGSGFAQYEWTTGQSTATIDVSVANTYGVTITDGAGCSSSDDMTLTVNANPTVNLSDATVCQGTNEILDAGAGMATYSWTGGSNAQTRTVGVAGTYGVTVTDINGCEAQSSMTLTVNSNPAVSLSDAAICQGEDHTLDAGAGFTYEWTDGSNGQTVVVNTTSTLSVTITDGNNCTATATATVTVNANPTIGLPELNDCAETGTTLDITGTYASYLWSTGAVTPSISIDQDGTYGVTVTNVEGCSASDEATVTLFDVPALGAFIDNPITCYGDTANLIISLDDRGNEGPFCIDYTDGTNVFQVCGLVDGENVIELPGDQSAEFTILAMTAQSGCTFPDEAITGFNLEIAGAPAITVDTIGAICTNTVDGASVVFTMIDGEQPWDLQYRYEGELAVVRSIAETSYTIKNAEEGVYEFILLTDDNGCRSSSDGANIQVEILPPNMPEMDYTATAVPSCDGMQYTLEANGSNLETLEWQIGDMTSTDNPATIVTPYGQTADIQLNASTSTCNDVTNATADIGSFDDNLSLSDQNVFTPGDDGFNDLFDIDPNNFYTDCSKMWIYNRWGTLIYEGESGNSAWDGLGMFGDAPEGTYFVIFEIEDHGKYSHSVTLLRAR